MLFHVPLKTLSQWTESDRLPQADAEIQSGKVAALGPCTQEKAGTQMTYRFQPLLFNHYLQTGSTKQTKTILILHSLPRCISDQRFCGPRPLMYLRGLSLPLVHSTRWLANYSSAFGIRGRQQCTLALSRQKEIVVFLVFLSNCGGGVVVIEISKPFFIFLFLFVFTSQGCSLCAFLSLANAPHPPVATQALPVTSSVMLLVAVTAQDCHCVVHL